MLVFLAMVGAIARTTEQLYFGPEITFKIGPAAVDRPTPWGIGFELAYQRLALTGLTYGPFARAELRSFRWPAAIAGGRLGYLSASNVGTTGHTPSARGEFETGLVLERLGPGVEIGVLGAVFAATARVSAEVPFAGVAPSMTIAGGAAVPVVPVRTLMYREGPYVLYGREAQPLR